MLISVVVVVVGADLWRLHRWAEPCSVVPVAVVPVAVSVAAVTISIVSVTIVTFAPTHMRQGARPTINVAPVIRKKHIFTLYCILNFFYYFVLPRLVYWHVQVYLLLQWLPTSLLFLFLFDLIFAYCI